MISQRIRFGFLSFTAVAVIMMSPMAANVPAFAASTDTATSGFAVLPPSLLPTANSQELNNTQVTAFAEHVVNVGGGTWDYGTAPAFGGKEVWSKYMHRSLKHHTSVFISGKFKYSQIEPPNVLANVSLVSPYFWDYGYAYWGTDGP